MHAHTLRSREIQVGGDGHNLKVYIERTRLVDVCSHRNHHVAFKQSRTTPRRVRGRNWPLRRCGGRKSLIRYVRAQNSRIPPLTFPNATIMTRLIPKFQRFLSKTIFPSGVVIHVVSTRAPHARTRRLPDAGPDARRGRPRRRRGRTATRESHGESVRASSDARRETRDPATAGAMPSASLCDRLGVCISYCAIHTSYVHTTYNARSTLAHTTRTQAPTKAICPPGARLVSTTTFKFHVHTRASSMCCNK